MGNWITQLTPRTRSQSVMHLEHLIGLSIREAQKIVGDRYRFRIVELGNEEIVFLDDHRENRVNVVASLPSDTLDSDNNDDSGCTVWTIDGKRYREDAMIIKDVVRIG